LGIANDGNLVCKGTPDSIIVFTTTGSKVNGNEVLRFGKDGKYADLEYVKITNFMHDRGYPCYANITNSIIEYNEKKTGR
jgi:hypothetical protein